MLRSMLRWTRTGPMVSVVNFKGMILSEGPGPGLPAGPRGYITPEKASFLLDAAFWLKPDAVVLNIDCPGGQPAATEVISAAIRRRAETSKVPVLACAESVAASGGYWIMCAADELYAHSTTLVGSIGVRLAGFGFTRAMEKLGIERRLLTSGELKGLMDPFKPLTAEQEAALRDVLTDLHESFKHMVLDRRGGKLKGDQQDLFSGRVWTGKQALEKGLIDGVEDMHGVLLKKFGPRVHAVQLNPPRPTLFGRMVASMSGVTHDPKPQLAGDVAAAVLEAVERRSSDPRWAFW